MTDLPLDLIAGILVVGMIGVFVAANLTRRKQAGAANGSPPPATAPAPARARISARAHLLHLLPASSTRGPEPVRVPVSGHSLVVEVQADPGAHAEITALRAEVVERLPLDSDMAQHAVDGVPLETPQFEVLLDAVPPIVRPTLGEAGQPLHPGITLPVEIPDDGQLLRLVLAPVTGDMGLLRWRLMVDLRCAGDHSQSWDLLITGDTGWRTFLPGGDAPRMTPPEKAADHWGPKFPATPDT
jgi:hypothetical protein